MRNSYLDDSLLKSLVLFTKLFHKPYTAESLVAGLPLENNLSENLLFSKDKNALKKVKEHIVLLKNNNNNLSVTSLSIFNNFKGKNNGYLSICYISSDKELKADIVKTVTEK